ncbi:MAG: hypothetical protein IRZ16_23160 [Myxococcaceae bacterium]|nr:hypothetical protein [Myxococcaceae bacterium]
MPDAPPRRRPSPEADEAPQNPRERFASSVAKSYALYETADAETELRRDRPVGSAAEASRHPTPTGVLPAIARDRGPKKRAWYSVRATWLVLLALAGGVTYATTRLDGPLGRFVQPGVEAVEQWVRTEFAGEPPPPPPSPIIPRTPPGPPPELAARFARPAPSPEPAPAVQPPPAETAPQPAAPERKTTQTPASAKPVAAVKKTPKPAAQPQPPATPATTATTASDEPIEVEVLDTHNARAAERDGVGWLTLYTVPPAFVYDGDTRLGTTPLIKVPLPKGVYRLRVMDPDSKYRMLSVPIRAGEEQKLKIRVSDLPLDPTQD